MEKAIEPELCRTMKEVRQGVDTVDAALVELLAQRFGYMRAAARIKQDREAVPRWVWDSSGLSRERRAELFEVCPGMLVDW